MQLNLDQNTTDVKVYDYRNGQNNELTVDKIAYIKNMRLDLCDDDICHKNTGMLNLEYMKVVKGAYWQPHLTQKLKEMVCTYGAYKSQYCVYSVMKRHKFKKENATRLKVKDE